VCDVGLRRGAARLRRAQAAQLRVHARHGVRAQLPDRRDPAAEPV